MDVLYKQKRYASQPIEREEPDKSLLKEELDAASHFKIIEVSGAHYKTTNNEKSVDSEKTNEFR